MALILSSILDASNRQLLGEWGRALLRTPQIFRRLAFRRRTLEEELQQALLRGSLRKAFGGFDLLMLGLGITIASGWVQLTGAAAQYFAGPSVIVSYFLAGLAALLSAVCFAELCAEFPVSGGAFSYVMVAFGELPAFIALASLLLEYALGMAATARGFTDYFTALINQPTDALLIDIDGHTLDPLAAAIVMIMSVLLSLGVRESAWFISGVTAFKLVLLLGISIVGYATGSVDNMTPFFKSQYDADGLFLGASVVFFSLVGFDAVANAAEEVRNVSHLPWAIVGTVGIATVWYCLLALALAFVFYPGIGCPACVFFNNGDQTPGFIDAFVLGHGMKWMQYVIAVAALLGIVTALTVGLFSISRIVMAASRDWLLPPFLARVSPRTQTPLVAQMVFGVIIAALAFFVMVDAATALVSFGTLVVLWLVCNAQMARRYFPEVQLHFTRYGTVETTATRKGGSAVPAPKPWALGRDLSKRARKGLVWTHLLLINATSIALAVWYSETTQYLNYDGGPAPPTPPTAGAPACTPQAVEWAAEAAPGCAAITVNLSHDFVVLWIGLAWLLCTASMCLWCPLEYSPAGWRIPRWLMPWLPSAGILLVLFCVGALPTAEYWKLGVYFASLLLFYLLYSLPMSYIKHNRVDAANDGPKVVELSFVDGQWQPARLGPRGLPGMVSAPTAPRGGIQLNSSGVHPSPGSPQHLAGCVSMARSDGSVSTSGGSATVARVLSGTAGRRATGSLGMPSLPPMQEEGPH